MLPQPKFKIGNVVCMKDNFHFNPAYKTISIGKIEAIHIKRGKGIYKGEDGRGILYTISGFSLIPQEKDLILYTGQKIP